MIYDLKKSIAIKKLQNSENEENLDSTVYPYAELQGATTKTK